MQARFAVLATKKLGFIVILLWWWDNDKPQRNVPTTVQEILLGLVQKNIQISRQRNTRWVKISTISIRQSQVKFMKVVQQKQETGHEILSKRTLVQHPFPPRIYEYHIASGRSASRKRHPGGHGISQREFVTPPPPEPPPVAFGSLRIFPEISPAKQ